MTDIVWLLRNDVPCGAGVCCAGELCNQAAEEIERLRAEVETWVRHAKTAIWSDSEECKLLTADNERLRAWNAEIALNARHFAEALREIAEHPTGGIGCNPEGFVKAARAALEGKHD